MVAAKTQVVKKGEIKWNLPPMIQPIIYRAGQTLRIEITITNPQEAEEDYVLAMSLSLLREAPPFIDITRLMGPLITIAMLGMMIPMMEKALKPRE